MYINKLDQIEYNFLLLQTFCFYGQPDQLFHLFCSIGRPKHVRCMAGALEGDIFIGPKAEVRFKSGLFSFNILVSMKFSQWRLCWM